MTLFYQTHSWGSQPQPDQQTIEFWSHLADKSNWRIVELSNGYYQTEYLHPFIEDRWNDVTRRESIESAERAIDASVVHYVKKIDFLKGPKVVKTFEK